MIGQKVSRLLLVLTASLVVASALPAPTSAQPSFDPQSLVGEWGGSWIEKHGARLNGQYFLSVEKVVGNTVHGRAEISGRPSVKFRFVGTLDGNRLTFGRDPRTELMIEGNLMRGSTQGRVDREITLTKRK